MIPEMHEYISVWDLIGLLSKCDPRAVVISRVQADDGMHIVRSIKEVDNDGPVVRLSFWDTP